MKKLLAILVVVLISFSVEAKPLPKSIPAWDIPLYKSPKNITYTSVYLCTACGAPYGRLDIHLQRAFAYTTCEYTSVNVLIYSRFGFGGFPRKYFWNWSWTSFTLTFPANSADAWVSWNLTEGQQVHIDGNNEVIPTDIIVGDVYYCY